MKYYTLQIKYQSGVNAVVHEMKDLCNKDPKVTFAQWTADLRKRLYTTGFNIQQSPTSWDLINPLKIHNVTLIEQEFQYATTT